MAVTWTAFQKDVSFNLATDHHFAFTIPHFLVHSPARTEWIELKRSHVAETAAASEVATTLSMLPLGSLNEVMIRAGITEGETMTWLSD